MELTKDQIAALTKKRWIILIASCLINLCIGSVYAWSVLAVPMAEELHVSNLSVVFSVANAVGFITMIIGGILNDKRGPRWIIFVGGIMFGIGMFTSGMAQSVGNLVFSYGIILGLGLFLVYGCTISNTIKFFPDKRGLVGGLTTASYGISSVIFAPVANSLTASVGVRDTFKILGVIFLIIVCVGSFFMSKCPDGFVPEGYTPPENTGKKQVDKTPGQMLKMPKFYVMLTMMICGSTFGMMMISNARSIAVNMVGVDVATASMFVSILCLSNTAGRIGAGIISDKIGRINTLMVALFIALAGIGVLCAASNSASVGLFAVGIILVGICFGTFMGVFPGFSTDQFGQKNNTVNYGIMWIGFCIASVVGPTTLTTVYSSTGHYIMAFLIAAGIAIVGLILTFIFRFISKKEAKEADLG